MGMTSEDIKKMMEHQMYKESLLSDEEKFERKYKWNKRQNELSVSADLYKRLDNICEVCGYMCKEGEKVEDVMHDAWTCKKCHYKEHQQVND